MSGKIDISQLNTPPEKHEFDVAKYFLLVEMMLFLLNQVVFQRLTHRIY